ncbi:hypothetical protein F2Q69_00014471 [Brassica cretica]|uniref:Uncharacterized protein n=1 Tax=Brassica cretica TaxID=69181 RepID=A0A8S9QU79_BRACR|nr:hypothetical protein F2Q69_00014471 [Brassica cretica]
MKRRDTIGFDESNPNVSKSLSQKTKQWCLRRTGEAGSASPGPAIATGEVYSRRCNLKNMSDRPLGIQTDTEKPADEVQEKYWQVEAEVLTARHRSHHTSRAQRNPVAEHKERQGTVAIFLLKLESGGAGSPY